MLRKPYWTVEILVLYQATQYSKIRPPYYLYLNLQLAQQLFVPRYTTNQTFGNGCSKRDIVVSSAADWLNTGICLRL